MCCHLLAYCTVHSCVRVTKGYKSVEKVSHLGDSGRLHLSLNVTENVLHLILTYHKNDTYIYLFFSISPSLNLVLTVFLSQKTFTLRSGHYIVQFVLYVFSEMANLRQTNQT